MRKLRFKCISLILTLVFVISCGTCTLSLADGTSVLKDEYITIDEKASGIYTCDNETDRKAFDTSSGDTDIKIASDGTNTWFDIYETSAENGSKTCGGIAWPSNVAEIIGTGTGKVCYSMDFRLNHYEAANNLMSLDYITFENNSSMRLGLLWGSSSNWSSILVKNKVKNVADAAKDDYESVCQIKYGEWYRYSVVLDLVEGVPEYATVYVETLNEDSWNLRNDTYAVDGIASKGMKYDIDNMVKTKGKIKSIVMLLSNQPSYYRELDANTSDMLFSIDNLQIKWIEDNKPVIYSSTTCEQYGDNNTVPKKTVEQNIMPKGRKTQVLGLQTHTSKGAFNGSDIHGAVNGTAGDIVSVYAAIVDEAKNQLIAIYPQELTLDTFGRGEYKISITDENLLNDIINNDKYKIRIFSWNKSTLAPYGSANSVLNQ